MTTVSNLKENCTEFQVKNQVTTISKKRSSKVNTIMYLPIQFTKHGQTLCTSEHYTQVKYLSISVRMNQFVRLVCFANYIFSVRFSLTNQQVISSQTFKIIIIIEKYV